MCKLCMRNQFIAFVLGNEVVTMLETIDGKPKACLNGYYYNTHKAVKHLRDGTMRYQCEFVNSHLCRAFIWVRNGEVTKFSERDHYHGPNPARLHHLRVRKLIIFLAFQLFSFPASQPPIFLNESDCLGMLGISYECLDS